MVAKVDPARMDHAVQLYVSGKPLQQAATEAGVGSSTLNRELGRRGIEARGQRRRLPDEEIVKKYREGASELALALEYGVDRKVIRRRLEEADIEARDRSEAGFQRYVGTTREERKAVTAAANEAARGSVQPESRLERLALAREASPREMSRHEAQFAAWMTERHVPYVREKAFGRYNLDFAMPPVAVEILGGEWHTTRVKTVIHGRRTPQILDAGWLLLFAWATPGHPMTEAVAEYVVACLDEARRDPSVLGEYRVIRGDGEILARGRREDYERTGIVPARYR